MERKLMYEAVFLDFHGTFTSNIARLGYSLNLAYETFARRKITKDEFQTVFNRKEGLDVEDALRAMIDGSMPIETRESLVHHYHKLTDQIYKPKYRHIIRKIDALGAKCIVVTNGKEQVVAQMLDKWNLTPHIAGVYGKGTGGKLAGVHKKPSPDVIDFVINDLRKLGIKTPRNKMLMVGDWQGDIGAGNSAGLHTAFLITGPNQLPEYYQMRPTYALLDRPTLQPNSPWLQLEGAFLFRDLPKIVSGDI